MAIPFVLVLLALIVATPIFQLRRMRRGMEAKGSPVSRRPLIVGSVLGIVIGVVAVALGAPAHLLQIGLFVAVCFVLGGFWLYQRR